MKVVIQRVKRASLFIEDEHRADIGKGLVILAGIGKKDTRDEIEYMGNKILSLRIFGDERDRMNYSIKDIDGELMIVPQFTLYGDCSRGNRPDFTQAADPAVAKGLYENFVKFFEGKLKKVVSGKFGSKMIVEIHNDGPVTIIMKSKNEDKGE